MLVLLALLLQADDAIPTVRVLIQSGKSATVECRSLALLTKPGAPKPLLTIARLTASEIALADGKFTFLGQKFDEPWLTLEARDSEQPIKLSNGRAYAGLLHFVRDGASFQVVSEVDIETYLYGVVGSEIGPGAPYEAMKVQAVCARSYAIASMGGLPRAGEKRGTWDLYDDTRSQVYVGVPAANANLKRAIRETAGVCVMWKKDVVKTYFSSSCGGHTLGVREWSGGTEIPPLSGVACGFCEGVPNGKWTAKTTLAELTKRLKNRTGERALARVTVKSLSPSGRVAEVLIEAKDGKRIEVSGDALADACGGRNRMYVIRQEAESLVLEGKGYGHGVGMCQYGAINMAQKDRTCEQILSHYFPQSTISPVYGKRGKP